MKRLKVPRASIAVTILDDPDFIELCQTPGGREQFACFAALLTAAKTQDNGGEFGPSRAVVAMMIRWPEVAFTACLDRLLAMPGRWLEPTESGGFKVRNFAKWNPYWGGKRESAGRPKTIKRKSRRIQDGIQDDSKGVDPVSVTVSVSPIGDTKAPSGFVLFWDEWPAHFRKKARPQCLKAWKANDLELIADTIIASVQAHKRSAKWVEDNGKFIPGPLPWLNQRGWEATPTPALPKSLDGCPDPANRDDWWRDEDGTWVRKDTSEFSTRFIAWEQRKRARRNGT